MVHPVLVNSSMRGMGPGRMGPKSASMSHLKLSGKLPKVTRGLCTLPPILEPPNESGNACAVRAMQQESKSVTDLNSFRPDSSRGCSRESKDGSRRTSDPFYDFLHGSPFKPQAGIGKARESEDEAPKKVTKASIAEQLQRLRQDDRDLRQGFRSLQAKSKHEGVFSGGVSLLQGETLARNGKTNVKLPSLPTANHELQKLQELMKKQHRELGFTDEPKEDRDEQDFRSAFRSLLK
eukprot:gnl/MRDRNA2_/MRDRNA2_29837_c0_seq1.p1 gnl/MRDRNA2_/MRDRNA2_29837_c0~~gnl/MRDRNA2_/MRDRNA2_29837_c0_seq1.p1  ORF type:complete len:259 (+),score=58.11 gnl/MRDRNA2_/MRDRNA2_29837_c0_seq1:71-778(+)